ncbi:metal transporter CNNM4 [Aplysia californica]|uniref:Metal transporter CNNM4 n=1 Tax=Aplysia californica TaxID=6500 RepID=A0ABM0JVD8_APLCA|nr:metal transporter CNNM4 [Aplysia californica]
MESIRTTSVILILLTFVSVGCVSGGPTVVSIFPADLHSITEPGGRLKMEARRKTEILLTGSGLEEESKMFFTPDENSCAGSLRKTRSFTITDVSSDGSSGSAEIELLPLLEGEENYYICVQIKQNHSEYQHQGNKAWLTISVYEVEPTSPYMLPLGLQISIVCVLLVLSGLFSGLNLGLMALDQTELEIIERVGSQKERKYAKRIAPLRKRGNFLLCTLLLGNVMVNSTFTILFDNLTNGLIAVISSTVGIVLFGEIIPQAICSRHGLAVGAKTYWLTRIFMIVTFPVSFPISLILDRILGEEMGQVYNKEKLQELIRMTADRRVLHDNEANIISGALQLTNKSVEDVMTKIEDVYMLEIHTCLDFETLAEIMRHGYTRVPVYDAEKTNIVSLLNTKDLALIDPDDNTLLSTICKFYDHKPLFVDFDSTLDAMLQEFLHGNSHMAIVQKLHNTEDQDPYYETMGVVTLEDVIEEILQSEIIDETDMMTDNRLKELRPRQKQDYSVFGGEERSKLSQQLAFVAFQFLTTTVEPFSDDYLARNVVKNLMKKDIVVNLSPTDPVSEKNFIYRKGVASDVFVLVLQGTVEVTIGDESMVFETGPFSYFGVESLKCIRKMSTVNEFKSQDYIPDFSVRALTDVQYLCIRRSQYLAGLRTTRMIRQQTSSALVVGDAFEEEYEKATKGNTTNSNSVLDSHSPSNLPLEALKHDDWHKKKSTSSLDRLTFFHRKPDPHEILNRMRRSGSDAKDRCAEYHGDVDSSSWKRSTDAKVRKYSEDAEKASPQSPAADHKSKSSHSSLPFAALHSNHKLDILPDEEKGEGVCMNQSEAATLSATPAKVSSYLSGSESSPDLENKDTAQPLPFSGQAYEMDEKALSDSSANGKGLEKVPLVVTKPSSPASKSTETPSSGSQNFYKNISNAARDAEKVPLMHQEGSSNDVSPNDPAVS